MMEEMAFDVAFVPWHHVRVSSKMPNMPICIPEEGPAQYNSPMVLEGIPSLRNTHVLIVRASQPFRWPPHSSHDVYDAVSKKYYAPQNNHGIGKVSQSSNPKIPSEHEDASLAVQKVKEWPC